MVLLPPLMCVRVCLFAMVRGMLWKSDKPSIDGDKIFFVYDDIYYR